MNLVGLDFGGNRSAPSIVEKFLQDQIEFMDVMVQANPDSVFWKYIGFYMAQVRYMHAGYMERVKRERLPSFELSFNQLYYLTFVGDLEDLLQLAGESEIEP